jgi:DNA-binding transcriptional regulator GbsR (MarR family)
VISVEDTEYMGCLLTNKTGGSVYAIVLENRRINIHEVHNMLGI